MSHRNSAGQRSACRSFGARIATVTVMVGGAGGLHASSACHPQVFHLVAAAVPPAHHLRPLARESWAFFLRQDRLSALERIRASLEEPGLSAPVRIASRIDAGARPR